jgi:uncharacterized protein YhhL (DUF1145 family)
MHFGLPHLVKYDPHITNSMLHNPNQLEMHTKPLWTFLIMDLILLLIEEMEILIELMKEVLLMCHSTSLLQKQQQQHHYYKHQLETLCFMSGIAD